MSDLNPNYLQTDFYTLVDKFRTELQQSETFKDVLYEGSNISALLELMSYIGELNTFFVNKIAKNTFEETSDIYETSHSLAKQKGYDPKGPRSSKTMLTIEIDNKDNELKNGDIITVANWREINSTVEYDNEQIVFSTTTEIEERPENENPLYTFTINPSGFYSSNTEGTSGSYYIIQVPIRQGKVRQYGTDTNKIYGKDLIDNQLILPLKNYAYDDSLSDYWPTMQLSVENDIWYRINDFYAKMTGLEGEITKVYKFEYDKYRRNKIVFSGQRSIPANMDRIKIILLETLGLNGNVAANTIINPTDKNTFIYNNNGGINSQGAYINSDNIKVFNLEASSGGSNPEVLSQIKNNSRYKLHAQFRNVNAIDYKANLEERSDILSSNAWGEQDIAPSGGDTREYNKVYLSLIPDVWNANTINVNNLTLIRNVGSLSLSASIIDPISYSNTYTKLLWKYLEPRKMLTTYEVFTLPNLIYFIFDIELRIKRTYQYEDVKNDVLNKLEYYFNPINRNFNEEINFFNIINYIVDPSQYSSTDNFSNINGIENIEFRDIDTNVIIYEPNNSLEPRKYPQYTVSEDKWIGDNKLRSIQLDYDQFPALAKDLVVVYRSA